MKMMKKQTIALKPCVALVLALTCFLAGSIPAEAKTLFSRIIVFGDSLSDTGNFHQLTGGLLSPAPYDDGRFSNGPLWVEHLADELKMKIRPGDNYAVAGATTGSENSNDGVLDKEYPGLQDQIDEFLASRCGGRADSDALYIVWAGANDFFVLLETGGNPAVLIGNGVANTVQAIQRLRSAGARHILVANVPDLGLTPFARSSGMSAAITQLCAAYNQALAAALDSLEDAGIRTVRVDAFSTLGGMVDFPSEYGLVNVTNSFLTVGGDPDEFLFWDSVHPTTRGHEVLADEALDRLADRYSIGHGNGNSKPGNKWRPPPHRHHFKNP